MWARVATKSRPAGRRIVAQSALVIMRLSAERLKSLLILNPRNTAP